MEYTDDNWEFYEAKYRPLYKELMHVVRHYGSNDEESSHRPGSIANYLYEYKDFTALQFVRQVALRF